MWEQLFGLKAKEGVSLPHPVLLKSICPHAGDMGRTKRWKLSNSVLPRHTSIWENEARDQGA
jgi:hypothetical protein